jgi:hypothetical protein
MRLSDVEIEFTDLTVETFSVAVFRRSGGKSAKGRSPDQGTSWRRLK